jgi:mono/diheme cytochrome c family protein
MESTYLKKILLGASAVALVLLLAALIEENGFPEWRLHQRRYARLLEVHATDELGRMLKEHFRVELKQVVVPELKVVDRCVSCHSGLDDPRMREEANPHRTHPGTILDVHPYAAFGCSICHQGQGRATVFEDAKGEGVHWDYPLLPKELSQSSCAVCHAPDGLKDSAPLVAKGYDLFVRHGCFSCHRIDGTGGSLGPQLDAVGAKRKAAFPFASVEGPRTIANWHVEHLRDPQKIVAGSRMKQYGFSTADATALTAYVLSLRGLAVPLTYVPKDRIAWEYRKRYRAPLAGEDAYSRYCAACHGDGLESRFDPVLKRYLPTVRNPAFVSVAPDEFLKKTIEKGRPGRDMPAWEARAGGLSDQEISGVVAYLRGGVLLSPLYDPSYRAQGSPERGHSLYGRTCAGCHGARGEGGLAPALGNVVFRESATDAYVRATIVQGRHGTAMRSFVADSPSFPSLTEEEIADLVSYIKTL